MTGFNDREKAFEGKFAHEQKLGFELEAKCSKLFGLWAASELGLEGKEAQTYASEVVAANMDEPGFEDVIRKVSQDFEAKGIDSSHDRLSRELEKALSEAQKALG